MANYAHLYLTAEGLGDFVKANPDVMNSVIDGLDYDVIEKTGRVRIFLHNFYDTEKVVEPISAAFGEKDILVLEDVEGFNSERTEYIVNNGQFIKQRSTTFDMGEEPHTYDYKNPHVGEWVNLEPEDIDVDFDNDPTIG